jgi:Tfp pilus assembly protein FimT
MIALAVLAIMAAIAIPNYLGWREKRHLQSSAVDVQAAINLAKMTAIRENTNVVLIFNTDNENYRAFIDTDADGTQDTGERTVRSKAMSTGIDLDRTGFGDKLTFDSRGLASGSGDITLINKSGDEERRVNVTITGMSRINY